MEDNYFINNPVFLKYKRRFDWRLLKRKSFIKKALINERIIEIPFAIKALSQIQGESRVLDLGCMESVLPLFTAGLGHKIVGFDFRSYPYRVPNFKFVQGSILELPFKDDAFDAVTCISTIEHIGIGFYNDPKGTLSSDIKGMVEIKRVIKRDGLLVLTLPYGVEFVNNQQRIYNKAALNKLLDGFLVKEMNFFKNFQNPGKNNYWGRINQEEAGLLQYNSGTECVCCIKAIRIK